MRVEARAVALAASARAGERSAGERQGAGGAPPPPQKLTDVKTVSGGAAGVGFG